MCHYYDFNNYRRGQEKLDYVQYYFTTNISIVRPWGLSEPEMCFQLDEIYNHT